MKKISAYNVKWLCFYNIYFWCIITLCPYYDCSIDDFIYAILEDFPLYVWTLILIPFFLYLIFPFILKIIGNWKIVKFVDRIIDTVYQEVKKRC